MSLLLLFLFQGERQCVNYILADLQSFREALAVLQRQVDDLDELKLMHYQKIIEHEEGVWDVVQGKVSCPGLAFGCPNFGLAELRFALSSGLRWTYSTDLPQKRKYSTRFGIIDHYH